MNKIIGTRKFYGHALAIMIPIMVQNGITNFVSMLDNIMVGQLGTYQMSGVAVANTLVMIYNLCMFGAVSGVGIFGAQFYGKGDTENLRNTFRFKIMFCLGLTAVCAAVLLIFGRNLSSLYLKGEGTAASAAETLDAAVRYIRIIVIGFVPYGLSQAYASTIRETGNTVPPMVASIIAVCVNLSFNYLLIFGHFGFPALGVEGAAAATVLSRFAEFFILFFWTYKNRAKNSFIIGAYKSFNIPLALVGKMIVKAFPLMLNETFWATGTALVAQCYSVRGLNVVAANNICNTFWMVFSVAFMAAGITISIMAGQQLGAGEHEKAKDTAIKLIFFSVFMSIIVGSIFALCSGIIPRLYNTSNEVRNMARILIIIAAVCMPIDAFSQACYFTLRSGGKVLVTLLFDSFFICFVTFPVLYVLVHYTSLNIYYVFFAAQAIPIVKSVPGFILVNGGMWLKTLSGDEKTAE